MIRSRALVIALLLSPVALSACNPRPPAAEQAEAPKSEQIVATFGDQTVTMAELELRASPTLIRLEQDRFATLRDTLDQVAVEKMMIREAESRGITPEELVKIEIDDKVGEPREEQIRQYYERNKDKTGDRTYEDLYDLIVTTIKRNQTKEQQRIYVDQLKKRNGFRVKLEVPRTEVAALPNELTRGAEDAPVTIVEFTDFQCPYCKRVHVAMERLLVEYGDRIRFVYRDYPLESLHDRAIPASEAARCAADQDKFWDYYQHLMSMRGDMGDEDLTKRATEVGLDVEQFNNCYSSGLHKETVQASLQSGANLGVNSTPTFFINGRRIIGSKTYDELKVFIEDELARVGASPNVGG